MAPRLIELCFQTAGIWELGTSGRMGLPQTIGRVRSWTGVEPGDAVLYAVVTPDEAGGSFDARVVDASGKVYVSLEGYRTVELPGGATAEQLEPLARAMRA
jgi:hypothetical protein